MVIRNNTYGHFVITIKFPTLSLLHDDKADQICSYPRSQYLKVNDFYFYIRCRYHHAEYNNVLAREMQSQ